MGLREKVTIALVIIVLIQIACRHCMPRSPRKASLKRYLNDLKPVKNNPAQTPYSKSRLNKTPKQTFGRTAQHARTSQNSLPNKSLYQTYNFPENEFPLDNSPRDAFRIGMNFNDNYNVNNLQKSTRNSGNSAITDMKKDMKMKRKLLSNRDSQLQREMSARKFTPSPDSVRLLDSETFPEVQYPLNTMETWGPNYWNYLPYTQEKPFNGFEQQLFNSKTKEGNNKPFTRLTKATASKFLQSYDKLKEEQIRTSTENSKRSNVGQTGLNFTKTATCERVSDDFIAASLMSNIPSLSTETKKTLVSTSEITPNLENTCPISEYSYHLMPIPYKVIEENTENIFPTCELKNNTGELQDENNSVIVQTLELIQEILLGDDIISAVPLGNFSTEVEKEINTFDFTDVPATENIPTTLMDSAKSYTGTPTEELSPELFEHVPTAILQTSMPSQPEEIIEDNATTVAGPLNVRMPLSFSEPNLTYGVLTNATNSGLIPLSNGNALPGSTSIIIIPINNNAVGKSQSHIIESTSDTPIILYIPSTQPSGIPLQTLPSLSLEEPVPNNKLYNGLSNMAPLQNASPSSNTLVSELLNGISDSGSSLPMYETLPTNSTCYNNENSPSSMREKSFSNVLIHKSLTDSAPLVISDCDETSLNNQSSVTLINTDTLPPTSNFEHPLFDFAGSDLASLSHGPYNNILNNELPIIAREINSNQPNSDVFSKDLFIPTQNVTSEYLKKNISTVSASKEFLFESPNDVPVVALNQNFLSETTNNNLEILNTNTPLENSNSPPPIFKEFTESLPIDKNVLTTPLIESPTTELTLPTKTVSDELPVITDAKLPHKTTPEITTNSTLQIIDTALAPSPILNSSPNTSDIVTLNTALLPELYKIRELIDKMLSSETLSPISDPDSQAPPITQSLRPNQMSSDSLPMPEVDKMHLPLPESDHPINNLPLQVDEMLPPVPVTQTSKDALFLPVDNLPPHAPLETESSPLPMDDTVLPTPVFETSIDNKKPYLVDNLVTPLSETVTSRTKDTPNNNLPSKMNLMIPDVHEVSSDDLPLFDNDLLIMEHQEYINNPQSRVSKNDVPMQVVKNIPPIPKVSVSNSFDPTEQSSLLGERMTLPPISKVPASDSLDPTEQSSLIGEGVTLTPIPKDPASESLDPTEQKSLLGEGVTLTPIPKHPASDSLDPTEQSSLLEEEIAQTSTPKVLASDLLDSTEQTSLLGERMTLPPISKVPSSDSLDPTEQSSLIGKGVTLTPVPKVPASESLHPTEQKSLLGEGVTLTPIPKLPASDSLDPTKQSSLLGEDVFEADMSGLSENADISGHSSSINNLKSTNLDKLSEEVFSEDTCSDIPCNDSPVDKMLPCTDDTSTNFPLPINKTPSTSKLPITKALLENVLSDITKGALSSPVAKPQPVRPPSLLKKTGYYVDENPTLSVTEEIPVLPVETVFPNLEHTDNPTDDLPFYNQTEDILNINLPTELPLPIDELQKDKPVIPTNNVNNIDEDKDVECPLSDITIDSNSLPVDKILLNTAQDTQDSGQSGDTLPLETDNSVPEISSLDIPKDVSSPINKILLNSNDESPMTEIPPLSIDTPSDQPLSNNKRPSSSKLPITKALLENVLADINTKGFPLPKGKVLPVASRSQLDKTLYFLESPLPDVPSENHPVLEMNEEVSSLPTDEMFPENANINNPIENLPNDKTFEDKSDILSKEAEDELYPLDDEILSSDNPTDDFVDLPTHKQLPVTDMLDDLLIPRSKSQLDSRIPITKALLQKVLSDITDGGFAAKDLPNAPLSKLPTRNIETDKMNVY